MCNMKKAGRDGPTKLPPHGGQYLSFFDRSNSFQNVDPVQFNYVAPVVKYAPAMFQPGPVYYDAVASGIGHQPYNFNQIWTAYSTPKQMDYRFLPSYKGSQSAASYFMAQQAMSQLLSLRSINSAGQ